MRAEARVRTPAVSNVDVAVAPKYDLPSAEKAVVEAPPLKNRVVVVALVPATVCVHASYDARKSDPAVAAVTCPPVVVLRIEPEAMLEIQRMLVDAVPVESEVVVPLVSENRLPVMRPLLSMVKSVVVENAEVDDAIAKSVGPE